MLEERKGKKIKKEGEKFEEREEGERERWGGGVVCGECRVCRGQSMTRCWLVNCPLIEIFWATSF